MWWTTNKNRKIYEINMSNTELYKAEKFFSCDCHGEGILVGVDEKNKEVDMAFFSHGEINPKPSLWERFKYALYHIRTGKKYQDQVVLDYKKTKELRDFLIKNID